MLLSILIPTFNRSQFLNKNLEILKQHIQKIDGFKNIEIVISNNYSSDNTNDIVEKFIKNNPEISVIYYEQTSNVGIEKNCLFVLEKAKGDYVMYLGDDDFIAFSYLEGVVEKLVENKKIHLILPSIIEVDLEDNFIKIGRDFELPNSLHQSGFQNCLTNSWRGHQLSGLVLKREGLYNSYINNKVQNIYPFIYFTGISCLNGQALHFTKFPVRVTNPGQQNKDWAYGEDGLINEIFDNYIKLPLNNLKITRLQIEILKRQPWRLWRYKKLGNKEFYGTFWNMWLSKNSTLLFKLIFPFEILKISLKKKAYKLIKS